MCEGQSAAKLLNKLDIKYLNKEFGVMSVLEFSYQLGFRKFYKCKCNRCEEIVDIRSDHLLKLPQACKYCKNSLYKEIADSKYLELRKYRRIYNSYKSNAGTRDIEFNLSLDNVIKFVNDKCYYCHDLNSRGIDRINSNMNYDLTNCVSCCRTCNFMKNNFTINTFFEKIKDIYEIHLKESSTTISKESTIK